MPAVTDQITRLLDGSALPEEVACRPSEVSMDGPTRIEPDALRAAAIAAAGNEPEWRVARVLEHARLALEPAAARGGADASATSMTRHRVLVGLTPEGLGMLEHGPVRPALEAALASALACWPGQSLGDVVTYWGVHVTKPRGRAAAGRSPAVQPDAPADPARVRRALVAWLDAADRHVAAKLVRASVVELETEAGLSRLRVCVAYTGPLRRVERGDPNARAAVTRAAEALLSGVERRRVAVSWREG